VTPTETGAQTPADSPAANTDPRTTAAARPPPPGDGYTQPKHYAWADLLRRTFATDQRVEPTGLSSRANCGCRSF
jgi:hypothetical protein